jgi:hypothetical protein
VADTIQGIRTWRQDSDFDAGDAAARPFGDPGAAARAARAAADAKYQAFVSDAAAGNPCLDFAAPDHDFDRCVRDSVPNPVLFQKQRADADAVNSRDVQQDGLGDCHFLAPLAALATTPRGRALIRDAIVENKNDKGNVLSWTVTLHQPQTHLFGRTTFRDVHVTVDGPYVIGHARLRPENGQNEVWPLVLEKAYATYAGGYNRIGRGGVPTNALEILTGRQATFVSLGWPERLFRSYGADELQADLARGKVVVLSTKAGTGSNAEPDAAPADRQPNVQAHRLLSSHAYFAQGIEQRDGKLFVKLGNPWGEAEPDPIPCEELSTWFSGVSIGSVP